MRLKVGQKRSFSFVEGDYVIEEILERPEFSMEWTWSTMTCPHCKEEITHKKNHRFINIEVLRKDKGSKVKDNILLLGTTLDDKSMIIPLEFYNDIFKKTQTFKDLVEE